MDASWSETGDRYMLKLFRDHLFHAVATDGRPWLDQAHLAHCLNQLDGGSSAKVLNNAGSYQTILLVYLSVLDEFVVESNIVGGDVSLHFSIM